MANTQRRYSKMEFARRGDAIYENDVRRQLKAGDRRKFAAIDIETGQFALDAHELRACHKLRKRIPDAQIWMVRGGSRYVHRIGGRAMNSKCKSMTGGEVTIKRLPGGVKYLRERTRWST
jgi:hypothetical protein